MSAVVTGEGADKRQRHVPNEMEQLHNTINHLSEITYELESKLGTVLAIEPPEDPTDKKAEVEPYLVTLAVDIRVFKYKVNGIIRVVESMHRRLEL
jgi:hypothetical protein